MSATLRHALLSSKPEDIITEHVLERIPFIFGDDWNTYRYWRKELGHCLGIDPREITLTGSACVGFSLNPHKNLKPFDNTSDVDVAIISEWHFSEAWHCLRSIDPIIAPMTPAQKSSLIEHKKRYVYWGCIATDRVLALLPFGAKWLEGLTHMAGIPPTEGRTVNARIYKDFRALANYQAQSVIALRTELLTQ